MSESMKPLPVSLEQTSETVTAGVEADREGFFEACGPMHTLTTHGNMSDVEDDDSEASFHSLADDFEQCSLAENGAETAFTAPATLHEFTDATLAERTGSYDHSGGGEGTASGERSNQAVVDASPGPAEAHVDARSSPNLKSHEDQLHSRLLADRETVRDDSQPEHRGAEQGDGATEVTLDNRTDGLYPGINCDDEGRGNDDTARTHGVDKHSDGGGKDDTTITDGVDNSLISDPGYDGGTLDEGLVVEDDPLLPEEIDICCLASVKAMDEEWELKVKDRDTDLSQEQLDAHTVSAVSEKREGNVLFASGLLTDAITRYNAGLKLCPLVAAQDRAMLYHNRAVAYDKLEERKLAVHSLTRALELDPSYCKALARRAGLHEALDSLDDALADYKALLELDPGHRLARAAVQRLPPIIEERNEKLKAEMLGKLKDLGNMFLRPFGLSTQNFQMQQDPNTGGYNINFQQNSAN